MSFSEDASELRSYFRSEFTSVHPDIALSYDNVPFDPPNTSPWVRLSIVPGDSDRLDIGAPSVGIANSGIMIAQVFIPASEVGDGMALDIADTIATLMGNRRLKQVLLRTPSLRRVGREGAWYQLNVNIPYRSTRKK